MIFRRAFLDKTIKMCGKKWKWFFTGITIGQYGIGLIKREKDDEENKKEAKKE